MKRDKLSFINKGSKLKITTDIKVKVTIGSILIQIGSRLNVKTYEVLQNLINTEIPEKRHQMPQNHSYLRNNYSRNTLDGQSYHNRSQRGNRRFQYGSNHPDHQNYSTQQHGGSHNIYN